MLSLLQQKRETSSRLGAELRCRFFASELRNSRKFNMGTSLSQQADHRHQVQCKQTSSITGTGTAASTRSAVHEFCNEQS
mmetsp:Transcript_85485/g.169642  ORF Transcript_85485/g.169642 Transcript_85485/m.169642 type:complete len:80 (-) Transcript_85485:1484-1723(-)